MKEMSEVNVGREIASAVQKYFGIVKVPHDELAKAFLERCQSSSVKLNNNSYNYYQQGNGPTVLLIHGYNSNLGSMVAIAQDLVEQGFKVVLFDAPAHGEAIGTRTTHVEAREVIRKIGNQLGEIHAVICHSLGAVWALCAWNNDFRAKTFISIAAPSTYKFLVGKVVELYRMKNEVADGLAKQLERRFGENLWVDSSPSEIVKTIDVPGLIIHGKNDDFVPPAHAEQLRSSWSKAKVEMVEDVGHFDILGSSKARELITTYLREFQKERRHHSPE
jgi:pimeloyl-ACP methyl ester carboxylesterase